MKPMRKIIFLNGSINSGKSTVANRLKEIVPNLAHVEVDDLHGFISWMPIEQAIHLNWENAALVTRTFIRAGIDVVFSYPLSRRDYEYVLGKFDGVEARFIPITLFAEREAAKTNRGARELTPWERERIDWMHENGLALPGIGEVVDTTRQGLETTVDAVIRIAGLDRRG
jgi:hypothetical protein